MPTQSARGRAEPNATPFTEAMRDRQARGKDPDDSDEFECVPYTHPILAHRPRLPIPHLTKNQYQRGRGHEGRN